MISVNEAAAAAPGPPGPGCAPAPRDDVDATRDRQRSVCHRRVPRRVGTRRSSSCRSVWDGMSSPLAVRRPPGRRERRLQSSLRLPPSVNELRQVVPVSDMRGRLGAGRARCGMAGGLLVTTRGPPAARRLGANRRTPCCRQPPKQARGSVDNMRILSTYRPPRLGRSPTWNSHSTVPHGPSPFSSTPLNRPPPWRPAYIALLPVDLPASRWRLLTYTCSGYRLRDNPAAEDEGVLL
jgi:hypothetical protein